MIGVFALFVLLGFLMGLGAAPILLPKQRNFLTYAGGARPRWTIEHHAAQVARALASRLPRAADQEALIAAVRAARVIAVPLDAFDPTAPDRPGHARYYLAGPRLLVAAKPEHWPRHLADGLAHVARQAALGDADPQRRDEQWFRAARAAVGCADVLPIEEAEHGRQAG